MKQKLIIISLLLVVFGSISGQEKVYYDSNERITKDINLAIEYSITDKSVVVQDSLLKKTIYYLSGQKKSEFSLLNVYKKGQIVQQKTIGEKWKWFKNGEIQLKAYYKDGLLEGEFNTYWDNGKQRRKDTFNNGKLIEGNCYDSIGNKISVYFPYEILPQFPGGEEKLMRYLSHQVKYPDIAMEQSIQGDVSTQFYVEADGKITNIRIMKNINYYLDIEAFRVINSMPSWTPGKIEGINTRFKYTLPIIFRLQ